MNEQRKPTDWPPSARPFLSNPPEGSVGIAIPMRDNLKFFKLTFHSVLDFTDHKYMLAIVNNMSGARTATYLESLQRNHSVNVLKYQKDHCLAAEANLAIRFMFSFANVKYGVLLTPDVVVEPNWLSRMVKTLTSNDKVGIVGPMTSHGPTPQRIGREDTTYPATSVASFCMVFRRETFESINGFDESFAGHGYEDQDFCARAEKAGWQTLIDASVFVHRFARSGMRADQAQLEKNAAIFMSRMQGAVPA